MLQFWAFEFLDINRPKHTGGNIFPRARRWICPKKSSANESSHFFGPQFFASRCQLNYVEESQVGDLTIFHLLLLLVYCFSKFTFYFQVNWQPYVASVEYRSHAMESTINLAKKRIPFRGIETWEYYLGERCLRQFGFPCRVPNDPPQLMHGTWEGLLQNQDNDEGLLQNQDNVEGLLQNQNDDVWKGISAVNLVNHILEYASWFASASIGRILNVNSFLGGVNIAEKVLSQWTVGYIYELVIMSCLNMSFWLIILFF